MARNKYPEETVQKILDVSYRLFLEKGYDHTTIQDIVNEMGMSKGAVYHHFKSKEEILDRIEDQYYAGVNWFQEIRQDENLNGLEKIRRMLMVQFSDQRKQELDQVAAESHGLKNNPRLIALTLQATMTSASDFLEPMIEEGVRDGSIQTDQPRLLTEVFMMLMNVWIGIYASGYEDMMQRVQYLKEITDQMGFPLIDEASIEVVQGYTREVMAWRNTKADQLTEEK